MNTTPIGVAGSSHNQTLGARGEEIATEYLSRVGYRIIARNWRTRAGELDVIARDHDAYVAVEVKTRSGRGYGHPFEAITARKLARIRRLLLEWATQHHQRGAQLRVDAIAITLRPGNEPALEHLRGLS